MTVFLSDLKPGPYQSRERFEIMELMEMAESIRENGVINPPLVAKNGTGYDLLAGERRWRASCAVAMVRSGFFPDLAAAVAEAATTAEQMPGLGGERIAVRLCEGDEAELHAAAVIDNHQRANLNPIEEARDFQAFRTRHGLTMFETAKRLGRSDAHVRNWPSALPSVTARSRRL
jgi:ParB family chromosome partitioning protein